MNYQKLTIIATVLFILLIPENTHARKVRLGINGGIAKLSGSEMESFNLGFHINGGAFYILTDNIYPGLRAGFTHFPLDDDRLFRQLTGITDGLIQGSARLFELYPAIRLSTSWDFPLNIFTEAGAGIAILNSEIAISGTFGGIPVDSTISHNSETHIFTNVSLGASFSIYKQFSVDLYPSVNLLSLGNKEFWVYTKYNCELSFEF